MNEVLYLYMLKLSLVLQDTVLFLKASRMLIRESEVLREIKESQDLQAKMVNQVIKDCRDYE